jgi:hypothetical protein
MTSSFSSSLKLELMETGENENTWGDKTNSNLNLVQQAITGYESIDISGPTQTTALVMTNAVISNARNAIIKLSGVITGNQIVTIPNNIQKTYTIENGTTGVFTVQFKTVSGTGPTFSTTDKGIKIVYSNGTDIIDINANLSGPTLASDLNVNDKFIISSSNGDITLQPNGTGNVVLSTDIVKVGDTNNSATITTIGAGDLILNTNSGANSGSIKIQEGVNKNIEITPDGSGVVKIDGLSYPTVDGTSGQFLQTNGSAVLSFATVNAGTPTVETYDTGTTVTWTKPTTANWVRVEIWGGGGSGGRGTLAAPSGGGGGGAYNFIEIPFSYLVSTVTFTVGAGGASQTVVNTVGNAGGTTSVSFGNFQGLGTTKTISAFGGAAGGVNAAGGRGGGGGGIISAGVSGGTGAAGTPATSTTATPGAGVGGRPTLHESGTTQSSVTDGQAIGTGYFNIPNFGGAPGGGQYYTRPTNFRGIGTVPGILLSAENFYTVYGGGGGGYAIDGAGTTAANAGNSIYGGGGGGGGAQSGTAGVGGTSTFGGAGSNGTIDLVASSAGSTPGGGSGGTEEGSSGEGGSGRVVFTYW